MSSSVTKGFCSKCHKVWTLETESGTCSWCGEMAFQQTRTQPRQIKSSGSRKRKQALVRSNGYDHLEGKWLIYYNVASHFCHKAQVQDRDDLLHDIILTLASVERINGRRPFTEAVMYRIASRTVALYWRTQYKYTNGLTCGNCSKAQRGKCHKDWLYPECPKAIKLESLNKPILDDDGNITELGDLIADDSAIDLDAWVDARTFLLGFPDRLLKIAGKLENGDNLTNPEHQYLWRLRQKAQKNLF